MCGHDDIGDVKLELECQIGPAPLMIARCAALILGASVMGLTACLLLPGINPPLPVPGWTVLALVAVCCTGLFGMGVYGLWLELRLRGLRVTVHERGLVLSQGRKRETCRWEMVAEVVWSQGQHGGYYRLILLDRQPITLSGQYFGEDRMVELGDVMHQGMRKLGRPPSWRQVLE